MLEKMKEIIADQLGVSEDEVTLEASFKEDLDADSLDLFELVMALEEEFDIEIPDADAEKVVTVTNTNGSVTALDVLKAVSGSDTETKETLNGKTYHYQGVLSWCDSQYGNYIPAVKMENHANSDLGKVFADDGTANKTANSLANGREKYFKLSDLNTTETESMKVTKNSTWNNTVHKTDWLSEKDYNNYSGWMTIIDGNTDNLGVDTVLSDTKEHTVCLDFSMMMGLDLGFSSYVQQGDQWIQVPGWK